MNVKYLIVLFWSLLCYVEMEAQNYEVKITPVEIDNLGGLQSYAVGCYEREWLLVGGRLDGLHRRQPFASFSADGKNQDLIVVNPKTKTIWRSPLADLPTSLREQLSSTNMQFYQDEEKLICTGGYAYSPTADEYVTFPYLTIIDIPNTIQSIKDNNLIASTFVQLENEAFRVTGGALNKIGDDFYLVGGHKFMGRYNPIGPDHGPGFEQEYTNEVRKFAINYNDQPSVQLLDVIHDEMNLRRRDYNLVPYISNGERELMVYSGVFQSTSDLPWLYPVSIKSDTHEALPEFSQYYNHYHCAYLPIYNEKQDEMSTLFFGGIAQFYEDNGWLVQDNDVPFVNTIAEVSRNNEGVFEEMILTDTMPGYLGAGSVFIFNENFPLADDGILNAAAINSDFQSVGHIYGGIQSSLPNIFWINTGNESVASSTVYNVDIRKKNSVFTTTVFSKDENLQFYPNPTQRLVRMAINLDKSEDIQVTITNESGKRFGSKLIEKQQTKAGRNIFVLNNINIGYGAFFYTVRIGSKVLSRKVIWSE